MTRTFLDAGVLIAAIRGTPEIADRAMEVLNDPERLFVSSEFVQLEVLPKAVYFRQTAEAAFYRAYFASAEIVSVGRGLVWFLALRKRRDASHGAACQAR